MPFSIFGKLSDQHHLYCHEDTSINGYKILNHDRSKEIYHVISKTATTRSKYRLRGAKDAIAIGSIIQGQIKSEYELLDSKDQEIGKVKITEKDIEIKIGENKYIAKDIGRAKRFDFVDSEKKYVLAIDKKILSIKDVYHIMFINEDLHLVAAMIAVIIDDYFH